MDRVSTRRQMAGSHKPHGTSTRNMLLNALEAALADLPWREMRVRDVTERAGTTQPAFYTYWPNLTACFRELIDLRAHQNTPVSTHLYLIKTLLAHEAQLGVDC